MNVSNEQAKSVKICYQTGNQCLCLCAWYDKDRCPYQAIKPTKMELDLSADLLEARELIKEMRLALAISRAYNCDCSCNSCQETLRDINAIIEKTKDYA